MPQRADSPCVTAIVIPFSMRVHGSPASHRDMGPGDLQVSRLATIDDGDDINTFIQKGCMEVIPTAFAPDLAPRASPDADSRRNL
jgi:hypothetical protein